MILKFGKCILTIKDAPAQDDAFRYYILYNSEEETIFLKEKGEANDLVKLCKME